MDQLQYDIFEYLLNNIEELDKRIQSPSSSSYYFKDVYIDQYINNLKNQLVRDLNVSYFDVSLTFNDDNVKLFIENYLNKGK